MGPLCRARYKYCLFAIKVIDSVSGEQVNYNSKIGTLGKAHVRHAHAGAC